MKKIYFNPSEGGVTPSTLLEEAAQGAGDELAFNGLLSVLALQQRELGDDHSLNQETAYLVQLAGSSLTRINYYRASPEGVMQDTIPTVERFIDVVLEDMETKNGEH